MVESENIKLMINKNFDLIENSAHLIFKDFKKSLSIII